MCVGICVHNIIHIVCVCVCDFGKNAYKKLKVSHPPKPEETKTFINVSFCLCDYDWFFLLLFTVIISDHVWVLRLCVCVYADDAPVSQSFAQFYDIGVG